MQLINHLCFSPKICKKDYYQAVFASQSYGTFFTIYACFSTEEDKENYYIKKIDLKLINYKGMINLGIANATFKPVFSANNKSIGADITLDIKAFEKENFTLAGVESSHPFPKSESFLNISRKLLPISQNGTLNNGVFDEEFYFRDGVVLGGDRNTRINSRKRTITPNIEEDFKNQAFSPRCSRSENRIL